jgi:signal transduction histidine kinase
MPWTDGATRLPSPETRDELEDFTASFNGLLDRLHEALERQKQFTGQASHQLRTPLAGLIATIDVTRRRQRTAQEHERVLDRLHADALRLWRVVEALLFLARADAEAGMLDLEQIDLAAWVPDHLEGWRDHDRALDLKRPETCAGPLLIKAHPALLGQLLDNLLENACKYSPAGSSIQVNLRAEPGVAVLAVEDHGCGISAEDLPHVFEPFYRSQQACLGQGGVGLGLAVVQRIASAHGGAIVVQSEPAAGSCFTLRLPAVEHSAAASAQISLEARIKDLAAQVT